MAGEADESDVVVLEEDDDESDEDEADVDDESEADCEAAAGMSSGGNFRADSGTDFSARERTSTVSRRSLAKRVIAKSFVCSFSRAAFRWRLRKSAWR